MLISFYYLEIRFVTVQAKIVFSILNGPEFCHGDKVGIVIIHVTDVTECFHAGPFFSTQSFFRL